MMQQDEAANQQKRLGYSDFTSEYPALAEIQSLPHWVCWRCEMRKDKHGEQKPAKIPYNPLTGQRAESDNPKTWVSYRVALRAYAQSKQEASPYHGLGFMFGGGEIAGIDFDHCIASNGTIDAWAKAWIDRFSSYTEYSPGKEGFHVLARGTTPKGINRRLKGKRHPQAGIEMYSGNSKGRYFTITGLHLTDTPTTIEARQEALNALYQEMMRLADEQEAGAGETNNHDAVQRQTDVSRQPGQGHNHHHSPVMLDDEQLLQKAVQASNGDKFRALFYQGNTSGYPSASEADMALCMMLAFWTGKDLERMDRLYRRSALYRSKWDSARSESTYGWETLHRAAARCRLVYDPQHSTRQLEQDITQVLQQIAQERAARKRRGRPYQITPKEVDTDKVLHYLEMNEYGDALFFAAVFSGQVCYDHTDSTWYLWNGHSWKPDLTGKVRQLVAGVLGSLYLKAAAALNSTYAEIGLKIQAAQCQGTHNAGNFAALQEHYKLIERQMSDLQARAKALRSAKRNANVLRFVESEMGLTSDVWDTDPWQLAVPNGVLDLKNGTCGDGMPDDYIRTVAPTEWTGLDTPCPRFEQFLHEIFADKPDRDELIAFVQRLFGYGITGLTTLHVFPILYGPEGRNGKDTLLATLKAVLGPLVGAVSNDVFIAQDRLRASGAATPHLCDLQGKRLAWGSETREGDRLNIAQIKKLTGGGDIPARQLHGHQYSFTPTHKLLLITNYKPHAEARDKAFWSRACLIEFGLRFVEDPKEPHELQADPTLTEALQQERSGILAWLVRGCLAWQQQGLAIPASVQLATDKYREEEDRLLLFIQECCIVKPEVYVKAEALFQAYRTWYEDNQFGGRGMNGKLFGDEMGKRFPRKRIKAGRVYQGIGLLASDPNQTTLFDEPESGVGSVHATPSPYTHDESASEANPQNIDEVNGVGCVGCSHVFSSNDQKIPPIEKKYDKTLHTLHQPRAVTITPSALEASAEEIEVIERPYTDPTPEEEWEDETL